MNNMKTRAEIVEKMEELYNCREKGLLPVDYVLFITDILDWVIGENDFLNTDKLSQNIAFFLGIKEATKDMGNDNNV